MGIMQNHMESDMNMTRRTGVCEVWRVQKLQVPFWARPMRIVVHWGWVLLCMGISTKDTQAGTVIFIALYMIASNSAT